MGCCNPKKSEEDKLEMVLQAQATLDKSIVAFQDLSLTSHHTRKLDAKKHMYDKSQRSSRSSIEASFLHLYEESVTPKFGHKVRIRHRKELIDESANKENVGNS